MIEYLITNISFPLNTQVEIWSNKYRDDSINWMIDYLITTIITQDTACVANVGVIDNICLMSSLWDNH